MAKGEPGSPEAARVVDEISEHLATIPATTQDELQYKGIEADRFNDLVTARSARLDFTDQGVPGVLWAAIIVGAVVTIGFVMIFGLRSALLHALMTAGLAALIGVLLFVAIAINHPFAGDIAVHPAPLERVLADFG
jgi:hypothetical protein